MSLLSVGTLSLSSTSVNICIKISFRFLEQLQPVLVRVRGVRLLWSEVEQLRAESYRQDNKEHEDMLLEVTNQMPTHRSYEGPLPSPE